MNPQDALLQQLQDIETPAAIGWWPLAPGWWGLIILFLLLLSYLTFHIYRAWRARRYRRAALKHHKKILKQAENRQAEALVALLKRCAFSAYPEKRHTIAGLYGKQFYTYLNKCLPQKRQANIDSEWFDCLYQKETIDVQTLAALAKFTRLWIEKHEAKPQVALTSDNTAGAQYG